MPRLESNVDETNCKKNTREIRKLYKHDITLSVPMMIVCILHTFISIKASFFPVWKFLLIAYFIGGTLSQNIFLANHELCHNHVFETPLQNRIYSLILNIPIGIPYSSFFGKYHLMHHTHEGVYMKDMDLPSNWEIQFIGNNTFRKSVWLLCQIIAYAIRPMLLFPMPWTAHDYINVLFICTTNYIFIHNFSYKSYIYLLLSAFLGSGLHPIAGHFLSEHYVLFENRSQNTYSYYGILNKLTYNVGYHNEHHDFPKVPGSKLPLVHQIAHDHYNSLDYHTSWCKVIWSYITNKNVGPMSRKLRNK